MNAGLGRSTTHSFRRAKGLSNYRRVWTQAVCDNDAVVADAMPSCVQATMRSRHSLSLSAPKIFARLLSVSADCSPLAHVPQEQVSMALQVKSCKYGTSSTGRAHVPASDRKLFGSLSMIDSGCTGSWRPGAFIKNNYRNQLAMYITNADQDHMSDLRASGTPHQCFRRPPQSKPPVEHCDRSKSRRPTHQDAQRCQPPGTRSGRARSDPAGSTESSRIRDLLKNGLEMRYLDYIRRACSQIVTFRSDLPTASPDTVCSGCYISYAKRLDPSLGIRLHDGA